MSADLRLLLQEELNLLRRVSGVLLYSYEKCAVIGDKSEYSLEEQDYFEALSARFARLCDILLQKIFRLLDALDLETPGTLRDRIHRAEKKGLIASADAFSECRLLRNEVAHEYQSSAIIEIFRRVLALTQVLLDSVEKVHTHCRANGWSQ